MELLRSLVTMSGACLPLAVLCILAHAVAVGLFLIWIKAWTDASIAVGIGDVSTTTWVTALAALCLCDLLLCSLGGFLMALSFRRLSARLHASMLRRVLSCALSFFEATPRGRLLNRFSADLHQVDCQLCMTAKEVLQAVTVTLAHLAAAGSQAPAAAGLGVLALAAYLVVAAVTVRASNALRCLENAWLSRILQHLTETRDSMSSVRCYGAAALVCGRFYRLVDGAMRPFWALVACVRLTRLTGAAAGLCAVVGSLLTVSLADSEPSQSGLGLALSASMSISMSLAAVNASLFFCFLNAIAFERALEYTRLPPEEDTGHKDDSHKPKEGKKVTADNSADVQGAWPVEGEIVFDEFTASYKPGVLPQVLMNVSLVIKAREKVGVVGRTGAGKSSLILSLLRVLRPSRGRIFIDGVDIASVPLSTLRSALTVIPQEPYLMKGSLRDNLDALQMHSDEELWEALRKAHLVDFVSRHPQGPPHGD
ncbi:hypothetical protein HPB49_015079 [Dermacentor silvarum]|uniref:Uncharacterized protein n=1 Tax=Dermacentor silvarum TaxID=543639 RepID=A0ACB8DJB6_DERSI|nr:hypothetical protein HPB49_015079 [Dermacentor silvarum]